MFHRLVNHNDDLRRLVGRGYAVGFDTNCLIIRDVPYLDSERQLQTGAIVTKLEFIDENRVKQEDHQIFFAGSHPHDLQGSRIPNLGGGEVQFPLSEVCKDVIVQRSFSNKPQKTGAYQDFYEKIESYITLISGPAMELHGVTPYTFRIMDSDIEDTVFKINDTLTSRAGISDLSTKFKDDVIAVIGLGGTGAYVLDYLVKTPVREIRAFDLDSFYVHNAFRSPGRLKKSELGKLKADVYRVRYENFRTGLSIVPKLIDASSGDDLNGVTFAFVCVDKGAARAGIFDLLLSKGIPFIDVGMGLRKKRGSLSGMLQTTYYSSANGQKVRDKGLAQLADAPDNDYRTNIQIGELNALNACLAVIKFKQIRGFYVEEVQNYHLVFNIGDLKIADESEINED